MLRTVPLAAVLALLAVLPAPAAAQDASYGLRAPGPGDVRLADGFWKSRVDTVARRTIPHLLARCRESGRVDAFARAAGRPGTGAAKPDAPPARSYDDADLYKLIEAIALVHAQAPQAALVAEGRALVDLVCAAQAKDGYLNTFYANDVDAKRWSNFAKARELWCGAFLIEAALAWQDATQDDRLLGAATRFAEHAYRRFGPEGDLVAPGYPALERALVRLARRTGDKRWLDLAECFVWARGDEDRRERYGAEAQDEHSVFDQRFAQGHAAKAASLYAGMIELGMARGSRAYEYVLIDVWKDVWYRHMYATGGIGSSQLTRGFTEPYELSSEHAACETCATVAFADWLHGMVRATENVWFAEALEIVLFNALPAAVALSGDGFSTFNPLASDGSVRREPWAEDPCCATSAARAIAGIARYTYAYDADDVYVTLYAASSAELDLGAKGRVRIAQETRYPHDGVVTLTIGVDAPTVFALRVRVPGWCQSQFPVEIDGDERLVTITPGETPGTWMEFEREWQDGTVLRFELPLEPRRVQPEPRVKDLEGLVHVARGPVVYALEGADHGGTVRNLYLVHEAKLESEWRADLFGGVHVVRAGGHRAVSEGGTVRSVPTPLVFVPYFAWGNRAAGEMAVWIAQSQRRAAR